MVRKARAAALSAGAFFLMASAAFAADRYWVGAAAGNWNDTANWSASSGGASGASVPGSSDAAIFDGGGGNQGNCTVNVTVTVASINMTSGYSGRLLGSSSTLTVTGAMTVNDTNASGAFLTSTGTTTVQSLSIGAGAKVVMAANGRLALSGNGTPLTGSGTLDVTTNTPNTVEYTGSGTTNVTAAGPAAAYHNLVLSSSGTGMSRERYVMTAALQEDSFLSATIDPAAGFLYLPVYRDPYISQIVKIRLSDYTRVGELSLEPGEKLLSPSVIDTAAGYLYVGTETSPAKVVKIRLSDFTRVGALTFNAGENAAVTAVIDTGGGYAYFGCGTAPGIVVRVRLSDFTRDRSLTLPAGDDNLYCSTIDTSRGFAYFGTGTSPGRIAKIKLSSFTLVGSTLAMNTGENELRSAVIDTAGGFAYFGTNRDDATNTTADFVIKVNIQDPTFSRTTVMTLSSPVCHKLTGAVIDSTNAYFASYDSSATGNPSRIAKIQLSNFTRVGTVTLSTGGTNETKVWGAAIDPAGGYAYFPRWQGGLAGNNVQQAVKVQLSPFQRTGSITLAYAEAVFQSAVIDTAAGFAYFGGRPDLTIPGVVVKVRLSDFTRVGGLILNSGENTPRSAVIDTARGFAYFGTDTTPTSYVVKVRLSDFTRVGVVTMTDVDSLRAAVIDTAGGFAYFASDNANGKVAKINIQDPTFSRANVLTTSITGGIQSGVIDPGLGKAWFGDTGAPALISQITLSSFTESATLTLNSGENDLRSAAIDTARGYSYWGTYTSPGKIFKLKNSDFTRAGVVTLNSGESRLVSATIDTAGGFAYFGTENTHGQVIKVNIQDPTFSRTGSQTFGVWPNLFNADNLASAVIDPGGGWAYFGSNAGYGIVPIKLSDFSCGSSMSMETGETGIFAAAVIDTSRGYLYFGTRTSPAIVVKVRLSDLNRVGAITLNSGENDLTSAVIDTAGGFAYFGTNTAPGIVVKINIQDPTFSRTGALNMASPAVDTLYGGSAIDSTNAYFTGYTSPGKVVRIALSSFTRTGVITMSRNLPITAVVDRGRGFLYAGTEETPAGVVKINTATWAESAAIAMPAGEDVFSIGGVIDPDAGFAYFGTSSVTIDPARIVKVNIKDPTFSRDSVIILNPGASLVAAGVIDPVAGYAYFGTNTSPGIVAQVNLSTFTRVGAMTLGPDERNTRAAVIDTSAGYAYFVSGADGEVPYVSKIKIPSSAGTMKLGTASGQTLTVNGNLTVSDGTGVNITTQNPALTVSGSMTINANGSILASSTALLRVDGTFTGYGGFTHSSGTVELNGSGTLSFPTGTSGLFYNLTLGPNSAGTTTLGSGLVASNSLTVNAGHTLDLSGYTLSVSGTFANNGTIRLQGSESVTLPGGVNDTDSGTWTYVGRGANETHVLKDWGTTDYYNLTIADTNTQKGTFRSDADMSIAGAFTITGGTYDANTFLTTVTGATTLSGGEYKASTKLQTLNGSLTVSGGTFTGSSGTVDVNGALTISSGTFVGSSGTVQLARTFSFSGGTFTHNSGTMLFDGTVDVTHYLTSTPTLFNARLNDGLLAYWDFDVTNTSTQGSVTGTNGLVEDRSGYGRHALGTLGAALSRVHVPSLKFSNVKSGTFPGADDYFATSLVPGKTFTWCAWFRTTSLAVGTYQGIVISYNGGSAQVSLFLEGGEGSLWTLDSPTALTDVNLGITGLATGRWYHVVLVREGDSITNGYKGYLDGVFTGQANTGTLTPDAPISIGNESSTNRFIGQLDEVRIYNRVLNATEISLLGRGYRPSTSRSTDTISGSMNIEGTMSLTSGTMAFQGNGTVQMGTASGLAGTVRVDGGVFKMTGGTTTLKKITGAGAYPFDVSGGTLDIQDGIIQDMASTGMVIGSGALITKLEGVEFRNGVSGGVFVDVSGTSTFYKECPGVYFDTVSGGGSNVKLRGTRALDYPRMVFEDRGSSVSGPGAGEGSDDDGDTNADGTINGAEATTSGIIQWVYTLNTSLGGAVQGFPVAARDLNTGVVYSTYTVMRDASGSRDRIYVLNADGDMAGGSYYFEAVADADNFIGQPWWDTEAGSTHVVYIGTSTGKVYKLVDNGTTLVAASWGSPASTDPFTHATLSEVTSPVITDRTNLYFGGENSSDSPFIYGVVISTKALKGGGALVAGTRIESTMSWRNASGTIYLYSATKKLAGDTAEVYRVDTTAWSISTTFSTANTVNGFLAATNVTGGDRVYVGETSGEMHCLNGTTLAQVSTGFPFNIDGSTEIRGMVFWRSSGDRAYYGDEGGVLRVLYGTPASGGWIQYPTASYNWVKFSGMEAQAIRGLPVPRAGKIFVSNANGKLYVINDVLPMTLMTTYDFGAGVTLSDPTVDTTSGRIRVGTSTGKVVGITP